MKPLILATLLALQVESAWADAPLTTPPAPIPMSQVNAYQPKSIAAQSMWDKITDHGKQEIYGVEHRCYFNPNDKATNYEILAIAAYDRMIIQEGLSDKIDEHSYITGFLDCKEALGNLSKKTSWGHKLIRGIGYVGLAASTPAGFRPPVYIPPMPTTSYIRTISPSNSPFPAYQVSSF